MQSAPPIEVLDALEGFCRIVARSPTLGGALPLRASQACAPLLEGNSVGREIALSERVEIERGLRRPSVARFDEGARVARRLRERMPELALRGLVTAEIARRFADGPIAVDGARVGLFTGLFVRAPGGVRVRVSGTANRRARTFAVSEAWIEGAAFAPVILSVALERGAKKAALTGEVATLMPLPARFEARHEAPGSEVAAVAARAHVRFFDRAYFEAKRRGPTRRYKRLVRADAGTITAAAVLGDTESQRVSVIDLGPRHVAVRDDRLVLRAGLPLAFQFDGSALDVHVPSDALAAHARAVRSAWDELVRGPLADEPMFEGALLYLTKYVTPHQRGEPHFFVKSPSLVVTPSGWSTVIEGTKTPGFDVLRGVVRTDVFHATPAVFHVHAIGEEHRVAAGDPLAELFPAPRTILESAFELRDLFEARDADEARDA